MQGGKQYKQNLTRWGFEEGGGEGFNEMGSFLCVHFLLLLAYFLRFLPT